MANSKSEQHIINLANPDLNRERLKGEIKPWDGFNDRNSPYLSGECLPLYTKTINGSDQWISPSLDVYKVEQHALWKNGAAISGGLGNKVKYEKINYQTTRNNYYLGGTGNWYAIGAEGEDGIVITNTQGHFIYPGLLNYGDGFRWENCVNFFAINNTTINDKPYVAVCWGGKCWVMTWDGIWSSSGMLTRTAYATSNANVCIYFSGNKVYFAGAHCNQVIVATIGSSSTTFTTLTSLTWVRPNTLGTIVETGTISPTGICMDQTGGCTLHVTSNEHNTRNACILIGTNIDPTPRVPYIVTVSSTMHYLRGEFNSSNQIVLDFVSRYESWPTTWTNSGNRTYNLLTNDDARDPNTGSYLSYYPCDYYPTNDYSPVNEYSRYAIFETKGAYVSSREEDGVLYNVQMVASSIEDQSMALSLTPTAFHWGTAAHAINWAGTTRVVRLLYNEGILQNVSIAEDIATRGNILFPWGSITEVWYDATAITVRDSKGDIYNVTLDTTANPPYVVWKDRYFLFTQDKFWNAYDIVTERFMHYADDWNGRYSTGLFLDDSNWQIVASATNYEYLINKTPFPGAQFNPTMLRYHGAFVDTFYPWAALSSTAFTGPRKIDEVDIYLTRNAITQDIANGTVSTTPIYYISYINNWVVKNYTGNTWVVGDTLLNIPMNCKYQTDLYTFITLFDGSNTLALQQQGSEYLNYYQGMNDTSFLTICCIQSLFFGLTEDGVYQIDTSNGIISNAKKIVSIKGLTYVAYTPLCIYFWDPVNRNTYLFTGDATLRPITGCSSFTTIGQCKFRPDTEETFMLTNLGLFVSAAEYCYHIPGTYTDIFFTNYGFALKEPNECTCYAYYPEAQHTTLVPMVLETMLYGAGNNVVSTTDCIYLRFFRGDIGNTTATVKISGHTLTDYSAPLQDENGKVYNITKDDWDVDTQTYYIRYQPTYQKGLGMSIRVESDVPLIYMGFGSRPETLQITK